MESIAFYTAVSRRGVDTEGTEINQAEVSRVLAVAGEVLYDMSEDELRDTMTKWMTAVKNKRNK